VTTLLAGDDICGGTNRPKSSPAEGTRHRPAELITDAAGNAKIGRGSQGAGK
jgi:hypothetical protein